MDKYLLLIKRRVIIIIILQSHKRYRDTTHEFWLSWVIIRTLVVGLRVGKKKKKVKAHI